MKQKKPYKILIVEDEIIIAEDLKTFLEEKGYDVLAAVNTGQSALKIYKEQTPDIVLMDIVLDDDMNGIEAANQMQEIRSTPVIFLTALKHDIIINNLKHSTAYEHILKPFKDIDLIDTIESMLEEKIKQNDSFAFRNRIEVIFEKISEGLIILSKSGNIVYANEMINNLIEIKDNRLVNEALFFLSTIDQEKEITLYNQNDSIPCLVKSINLNWDDDYHTLLLIKDLSEQQHCEKIHTELKKNYLKIKKKLGVGRFVIKNTDDTKIIDVNSAFIKKLMFKQYSSLISKKFVDILKNSKDFSLLRKRLSKEPQIDDHKITFIDQHGADIKAELMVSLIRTPDSEEDLIDALVFFLD